MTACRHVPRDPARCDFCRLTEARIRGLAPAPPAGCVHRGGPVPPPAGKDVRKRWALCTHPEEPLGAAVCTCLGCGPGCRGYESDEPPPAPFEWVSTAGLVADSVLLAGLLPADCSGVAGLPRSGMIPAGVIAAHLHLPLYQLTHEGRLDRLGHGSRGRSFGFGDAAGPLAVVDDTVYGGDAMRQARRHAARLGLRYVFAAVYARPEAAAVLDFYARGLPCPHLLEWNLANSGPMAGHAANAVYGAGLAFDIDGVVLHDAESGGPVGSPYLVPRATPAVLLVTGRHERHRKATEEHLRRVGCRWRRLEMLPDAVELTTENAAAHKARHYKASRCGFFVESCPEQAGRIHRLAGKPVICPRAGKVFQAAG